MVIAVIMKLDNLDYPTALARVVEGRPQACPNIGFEKQLILWKKLNFHINQRDPLYRIFLLDHNIGLRLEPLALGAEFGYKCRKCRKARVYKVPQVSWGRISSFEEGKGI